MCWCMPACSQPGSGDCLPWAPAGRLSLTSCWVTCYENIGEVHLPDLLEAPFWWFVLRTVLLSPAWGSGVLDGNILRLKEFGFFPDGGCYPVPNCGQLSQHQLVQGWQQRLQPAPANVACLQHTCGAGTSSLLAAITACPPHRSHVPSCCHVHALVPARHA